MSLPTALPKPTVLDPDGGPSLRWGLLGTGWIADRFATSLLTHSNQQIAAVGSRSIESAERFASTHSGTPHGSYESLVADPSIDVVYIASPHPQHVEHALLAVEAGKHVLVEKPVAVDAEGARRIARAAHEQGVFAMEAMWSLFLPKFTVLRRLLDDGVIGDVTMVCADLGDVFDPSHRIHDPAYAGGAMMDLGPYPTTLATWVLGEPTAVRAQGQRGPYGTMAQTTMLLDYPTANAALSVSSMAATPTTAYLSGSEGRIEIDREFFQPGSFTLHDNDGNSLRYEEPRTAHAGGLFHEALEVARCIGEGRTESPRRPFDATIMNLTVMDTVREQTGDRLVGETPRDAG